MHSYKDVAGNTDRQTRHKKLQYIGKRFADRVFRYLPVCKQAWAVGTVMTPGRLNTVVSPAGSGGRGGSRYYTSHVNEYVNQRERWQCGSCRRAWWPFTWLPFCHTSSRVEKVMCSHNNSVWRRQSSGRLKLPSLRTRIKQLSWKLQPRNLWGFIKP